MKNKKLKLILGTFKAEFFVLTNTGWKLLRRPRAVRLTIGRLLSHQLVAIAAVICDSAAERVTFAGVPTVRGICGLSTGSRLAGDVGTVPGKCQFVYSF